MGNDIKRLLGSMEKLKSALKPQEDFALPFAVLAELCCDNPSSSLVESSLGLIRTICDQSTTTLSVEPILAIMDNINKQLRECAPPLVPFVEELFRYVLNLREKKSVGRDNESMLDCKKITEKHSAVLKKFLKRPMPTDVKNALELALSFMLEILFAFNINLYFNNTANYNVTYNNYCIMDGSESDPKLQLEVSTIFYERLVLLCNKSDLTVTQLLKELNYSTSKGTAWKNGSIPSGEILFKIADYFNCSVDYLLGRDENMSLEVEQASEDEILKTDAEKALITLFRELDLVDRAEVMDYARKLKEAEKVRLVKKLLYEYQDIPGTAIAYGGEVHHNMISRKQSDLVAKLLKELEEEEGEKERNNT